MSLFNSHKPEQEETSTRDAVIDLYESVNGIVEREIKRMEKEILAHERERLDHELEFHKIDYLVDNPYLCDAGQHYRRPGESCSCEG